MKGRIIKTYIILLTLVLPLVAQAGPTTIRAKLDSASLLMGRQTGLRVEIVQDKAATGYIPLADGDTLTRNVEIVGWKSSDTTDLGNERIQIDRVLLLQSFDSGLYTLPPVLYVQGKDTFRTNPLTLKVLPVSVDSLKNINDYKPVQDPDTKWTDYLPDFVTDYWWLFLIAVALIAIAVYLYLRWKQGKSLVPPIIPKKKLQPPYEEAIDALSRLKAASLWQNGQEKEYYTRLTDILRRYIDRRFGVSAMEKTTSEILVMLIQEEAMPAKEELRKILEMSDFVKFAKMRPSAGENEEAYQFAVRFLEKTKPVEIPDGEKEATAQVSEDKNSINKE